MPVELDPRPAVSLARRPTWWRRVALVGVAAALAIVAMVALRPGDAHDDTTPLGPIAGGVSFTISPVTDGGAFESAGLNGTRHLSGTGDLDGFITGRFTMQGIANESSDAHDGAEFVLGYQIAEAIVPDCGEGELLLAVTAEYFETDGDPGAVDAEGRWSGAWQIVPYSGRQGLVGLTGSGTLSGTLGGEELTMVGTVDCNGSARNPSTP